MYSIFNLNITHVCPAALQAARHCQSLRKMTADHCKINKAMVVVANWAHKRDVCISRALTPIHARVFFPCRSAVERAPPCRRRPMDGLDYLALEGAISSRNAACRPAWEREQSKGHTVFFLRCRSNKAECLVSDVRRPSEGNINQWGQRGHAKLDSSGKRND